MSKKWTVVTGASSGINCRATEFFTSQLKMTSYYSVTKKIPKQHEWTLNQYAILKQLIKESGSTLFEKQSNGKIFTHTQYKVSDIEKMTTLKDSGTPFFLLTDYLDSLDNFGLYKNSVIGHGNTHGMRVAWLNQVCAMIENLPFNQTMVLIIAGLFHDIGRDWNNLDDQYHGEKSYQKLMEALDCTKKDDFKITKRLNDLILESLNHPDLFNQEDIVLLRHIICIHSLDPFQKELYEKTHFLTNNQEFKKLSHLFDDCDALDRLRFEGNLDIRYLNTDIAKSLIRYGKAIQNKF